MTKRDDKRKKKEKGKKKGKKGSGPFSGKKKGVRTLFRGGTGRQIDRSDIEMLHRLDMLRSRRRDD